MASGSSSLAPHIKIVSYNMNGFNQGRPVLQHLCETLLPDIVLLQEHWLTTQNLLDLLCFSPNYIGFGSSAMDSVLEKHILIGRPFGGTAILINSKWSNSVSEILLTERMTIVQLNKLLIFNVYLPYESPTSVLVTQSILDEAASVILQHPQCDVLFGGDMNCNLHSNTRDANVIKKFVSNYSLMFSDATLLSVNPNPKTYRHKTLPASSYIDFVMVSASLLGNLSTCVIIDDVLNLSDHDPVSITMLNVTSSGLPSDLVAGTVAGDSDSKKVSEKRLRWDHADFEQYNRLTYLNLSPLLVDICANFKDIIANSKCGNALCLNDCMQCSRIKNDVSNKINIWYKHMCNILSTTAKYCVPAVKPNQLKHWWDKEAGELKNKALVSYKNWLQNGKPLMGAWYDIMKQEKKNYKRHLACLKKKFLDNISDSLYQDLLAKNKTQFWKSWRAKLGKKTEQPQTIDGVNGEINISKIFANSMRINCSANNAVFHAASKEKFDSKFRNYRIAKGVCYDIEPTSIKHIIINLAKNKSSGIDGLTAEHFIHSNNCIVSILTYLFNIMMHYEVVPSAFGESLSFQIPKNSKSALSRISNDYRGISVNPIVSKIFEYCLIEKFGSFLGTSSQQFGFKKNVGCTHAIYALRKTIDYYNERGSTVNLCALDLAKAFDKLDRFVLFEALMNRGCPAKFIAILKHWFENTTTVVNWGESTSPPVKLSTGVRQGSILSPLLFGVFINKLITDMSSSGIGCHIKFVPLNVFLFADDLLIVAPSITSLQLLVDRCICILRNMDMKVNAGKSCCLRVGPGSQQPTAQIIIDGSPISWSDSLRYLGITFSSGRSLRCELHQKKAKFFGSINGVFSRIGTKSSPHVLLSLIFSKCVPIIFYGLESLSLTKAQLDNLTYVYNASFVKIFSSFNKEIIAQCQFYSGHLSFIHCYDMHKINFLTKVSKLGYSSANFLFHCFGRDELEMLKDKYKLNTGDTMSYCSVRNAVWKHFSAGLNL